MPDTTNNSYPNIGTSITGRQANGYDTQIAIGGTANVKATASKRNCSVGSGIINCNTLNVTGTPKILVLSVFKKGDANGLQQLVPIYAETVTSTVPIIAVRLDAPISTTSSTDIAIKGGNTLNTQTVSLPANYASFATTVDSEGSYIGIAGDRMLKDYAESYNFNLTKRLNNYDAKMIAQLEFNIGSLDGNSVQLSWENGDNTQSYHYMVTKKDLSSGGSVAETIPLKETAKVLNVYPGTNDGSTITLEDGSTISKSASVKKWMEGSNGYGKGLISVDSVSIEDFNSNTDSFLKDTDGKYKYDVVFVGAWDANNCKDISDDAKTKLQAFITAGGGYLAGHDTANGSIAGKNNLKDLAGANLNMDFNGNLGFYGGSTVNVVKKGALINYPWTLSSRTLTVPTSHSTDQFAMGDVWMKYDSNNFQNGNEIQSYNSQSGTNNFYLTTWNNVAMIQTGHSNGEATVDEQKVLANTLLYLSQVSNDTSFIDHTGQDVTAPNSVSSNNVQIRFDSLCKAEINFDAAVDNGNSYEYQLRAIGNTDNIAHLSEKKTVTVTSGIKGYAISVDQNQNSDPGDTVNTTTTSFTSDVISGDGWYVHIKTIDNAGNASGVINVPLPNQDQGQPTVTGVAATTSANNDGKITGTTTLMEYKLSTDSNYRAVIGTEIAGLAPGTYNVRYAAKPGYNVGEAADVVVGPYVPPYIPPYIPPEPTTVKGDVIDQDGTSVKGVEAEVSTEVNGNKIVEVKSSDAVLIKQPNGDDSTLTDFTKLNFGTMVTTSTGSTSNNVGTPSVSLKSDGTIRIENLANGTEAKFALTYDLGNGQRICIGTMNVVVSSNGDVKLTSTLIDPYGTITDSATGQIIDGVDVKLYYADTERNRANGKTPDTIVQLPIIDGFKPNNNSNPQVSDASGAYAFMVFPTTDYYIIATKDGYRQYKSPTISVEQDIVKWDFKMNKKNASKPVIVLAGDKEVTVKLNDNYTDQGATAKDSSGVDLTSSIVTSNSVNTNKVGDYTVTYNVTDIDGNAADPVMRTVHVVGVERLSGNNRVDTSIEIAKATYEGRISNVILATADNYPDALTGSVLAHKLNAPILLVGSSEEDQEKVLAYIKANMNVAGTVYILGGTGVVSSSFEGSVAENGFKNIKRLGGVDRYETSVKIAEELGVKEGTSIILVNGDNFADALSISSKAGVMGSPILLVSKEGISDMVKKKIGEIKPGKVYIIGLEGAVSKETESQATTIASLDKANVVRIGGANRYETSLEVVKYFGISGKSVCVATGNNFPDALAGSVYAANNDAPIILVDNNLNDNVKNYLKEKQINGGSIFGGESAVRREIQNDLLKIAEGE